MLNQIVHPDDFEAFSTEYEEEQELLRTINDEGSIIDAAWAEYLSETQKEQPKYARLARRYVPKLREIFNQGIMKEEAQAILVELSLAQTQPLSSLDASYTEDENGEYVEADSYTGLPLDVVEAQEQAERDLWFQTEEQVDPHFKTIPLSSGSISIRIAEEYRDMGVGELAVEEAIRASSFNVYGDEEDPFFEDRGITSAPIIQNNTQEMKADLEELRALREEAKPYLGGLRRARLTALKKLSRLGITSPTEEEIEAEIPWTPQADAFIRFMDQAAKTYAPQHILLMYLGAGILDERMDEISIPEYGTLEDFFETFGDAILDDAMGFMEPLGYENTEEGLKPMYPKPRIHDITEGEIIRIAEHFEEEIVSTFNDNLPAKNAHERAHTKAYAQGVFQALATAEGISNLDEAGHEAWRWSVSKAGASAFHKVLAETNDYRKAWRAFWNAGHITGVNRNGVVVKSEANGKEQSIDWGLARWKLRNHEIVLSAQDRQRLKGLLQSKGWGALLQREL